MNAAVRAHVATAVPASRRQPRQVTPATKSTPAKQDAIVEATIETTSKLVVNSILGCVTLVTLASLIPLAQTDTAKLQELTRELNATQQRVGYLQQQFSYYFDPQQARSITQEVGSRVSRNEAPVILIKNGM